MITSRNEAVTRALRKLKMATLMGLLVVLLPVQAATLPELANPSTLTGAATSAKFLAGVTADQGGSYGSSFAPTLALDINAEIRVESSHVNSTGNLYVVVSSGGQFYMRAADGNFLPWNGDQASLQATVVNKPLQSSETVSVVSGIAFGPAGLAGQSFALYLAYDSAASPGQLYFSGSPAEFSITAETGPSADAIALDYYGTNVSTQITGTFCMVCHVDSPGSLAKVQGSALLYVPLSDPNAVQTNFDRLKNYILNQPNGSQLILAKPQGQSNHGGAAIPGMTAGSELFNTWSEFVNLVLAIQSGSQGSQVSALMSSILLDSEETLRKAALLFAGRLPTDAELQQVADGSDTALRSTIRNLMDGDGFKAFLIESANDRLLSLKYESGPFQVLNRYYYPAVDELLNATGAAARTERTVIAEAIAREPLELIAHVVMNERPYTEILTADYIMLNPFSAKVYGGNVNFADPNDFDEWREGEITEYYRCTVCTGPNPNASYNLATDYPHAGLLNSPMFLARFPSTETNRNRARARWAYFFFLGVDIESLAPRTTDPAALADENNPTLNNPNCTVCHNIMDPVAGAFQNYGDDGRYKDQPGGNDALPKSYKQDKTGLYQFGDRWYADMLAPGFGSLLAPSPDESLQWLGQQFAKDSRFGYGAVNFWFPALMGKNPTHEPENPEDADYLARLLAYNTEQAFMAKVAADFMSGAHGNGTFNLKDLLTDLVMSEQYRAESAQGLNASQLVELEDIGVGRLLTPEQLDRKLKETTGYSWQYGTVDALQDVYGLIYGGIDSDGITKRATDLTTLMSTVVTTMANETACPIVAQDFSLPRSQRHLFTDVELNYLPTNQNAALVSNIQHLHSVLLGEELDKNDPEILATLELFTKTWQARIAAGKAAAVNNSSELCILENVSNPVTNDANQTLRSWVVVINYLLRDYRFIHE